MKILEKDSMVEHFETVTFPLMKLASMKAMNWGGLMRAKMSLDFYYSMIGRPMIAQLSTWIISNKVHEIEVTQHKYPANWIEAFKEKYWRFFPDFAKRKYPVHYKHIPTKIDHVHVCPHCDHVPWGEGTHMQFMTNYDPEYHSSFQKVNKDD